MKKFITTLVCMGFLFIYIPNHGKGYIRETDLPYDQTMVLFPDRAYYYDGEGCGTQKIDIDQALKWMWYWEKKYPRLSTMTPDPRPKGE